MPSTDAIDYLAEPGTPKRIPNQNEARLWCNAPMPRNRFPAANSEPRKTLRQRTLPHSHRRSWSRFSTLPQQAFLACVDS
ncbi:MAG: hypothetical protein EOO84_20390 [Pantoea sp.]|nr:MAG: hypothetical protein EOO84_20390 [Pantoea sp.]